jgi:hypothetical protein
VCRILAIRDGLERKALPWSLAALLLLPGAASGSPSGQTELAFKAGLQGRSFALEQEQVQGVGFQLGLDLSLQPLEKIELRAKGGFESATGYQQVRYKDLIPQSGLSISEAVVAYSPVPWLILSGGAVSAAGLRQPMLVSPGRGFPGFSQSALWSNSGRDLSLSIRAQQGILTSKTLAPSPSESSGVPHLFAENLRIQWKPVGSVLLSIGAGRFDFRDLTATQATEGGLLGNTTVSVGPGLDRFRFDFAGWSAEAGAEVRLGRWQLALETKALQNTRAEPGYRNAQSVGLEVQRWLGAGVKGGFKGEAYFVESDVSPAGLLSSRYLSGNRTGWSVEAFSVWPQTESRPSTTRFSIWYLQTELLTASMLQSASRAVMVGFETGMRAL